MAAKKATKKTAKKATRKTAKKATKKASKKPTAKRPGPAKLSARAAGRTVDAYVKSLSGWKKDVIEAIRRVVREHAPHAVESIKWGQPVYESNGPFAWMKAFGSTVNFGFWRGALLRSSANLLEGAGDRMRHLKLRSLADVKPKELGAMIREAVSLNAKSGAPTKRK